MLSPPNAIRARLPVTKPTPINPTTSTIIQRELKYSIEMALLILPVLQPAWLVGQQHAAQLEQLGDVHLSQEFSTQSHDWHE